MESGQQAGKHEQRANGGNDKGPVHGTTPVLSEGTVTIIVADTGIGISAGDLPRIFDRFHRAENARFRSGAGLGLAIAKRITEQHGGKIEVTSELCQGSQFTVTLPCL